MNLTSTIKPEDHCRADGTPRRSFGSEFAAVRFSNQLRSSRRRPTLAFRCTFPDCPAWHVKRIAVLP